MIAIASFRRTEGLRRLLQSIQRTEIPDGVVVRCVVVDNDAEGSAAPALDELEGHVPVHYTLEPRPGIAAARNAALDLIGGEDDVIIFVDDDEIVSARWLQSLLATAESTKAEAVVGPVRSVAAPHNAIDTLKKVKYVQRRYPSDGARLRIAATNNTLVRLDAWRNAGSPRFDEAYSQTGGSDTAFFYPRAKEGWTICFSGGAEVEEEFFPERLSMKWFVRRSLRSGNVLYRVMSENNDRLKAFQRAVLYLGYGVLAFPVKLLQQRSLPEKPIQKLFIALGIFGSALGKNIQEYKR